MSRTFRFFILVKFLSGIMLFSVMNFNTSCNGGLLVINFHFVYLSLYLKFICEVYVQHICVNRIMIWQTLFFFPALDGITLWSSLAWCLVSVMWPYPYSSIGDTLFFVGRLQDFLALVWYMSAYRRRVGFISRSASELLDLWLVIINVGKPVAVISSNISFSHSGPQIVLWIIRVDADSKLLNA